MRRALTWVRRDEALEPRVTRCEVAHRKKAPGGDIRPGSVPADYQRRSIHRDGPAHPRWRAPVSPMDRTVIVEGPSRCEGVTEGATSGNEAAGVGISRAGGVPYS